MFLFTEHHPDNVFLEQMERVLDLCVALWGRIFESSDSGKYSKMKRNFLLTVSDVTPWSLTNYQISNSGCVELDIKHCISSEDRLAYPYDFGVRLTNLSQTDYFLLWGVSKSVDVFRYCSEKSILTTQINNSICIYLIQNGCVINSWNLGMKTSLQWKHWGFFILYFFVLKTGHIFRHILVQINLFLLKNFQLIEKSYFFWINYDGEIYFVHVQCSDSSLIRTDFRFTKIIKYN